MSLFPDELHFAAGRTACRFFGRVTCSALKDISARLPGGGELNKKSAAHILRAFAKKPASVFVDDDVVGDAQTQACSLADRLGAEKRIEDLTEIFLAYPDAVVFDPADNDVVDKLRADMMVPIASGFFALIAWAALRMILTKTCSM